MSSPLPILRRLVVIGGIGLWAVASSSAQAAADLVINNASLSNVAGNGQGTPFNPSGTSPVLPWNSILTSLGNGPTTVRTDSGFNDGQNGDIKILTSPVGYNSANLLTFVSAATGGIFINANISNSGAGGITFVSGTPGISLGADITTAAGGLTFTGATTLTAASSLTSIGGGAISFGGTVDGARNLTINTAGAITFAGAVGATTPLTQVSIGATGPIAVNGGSIKTTGILSLGNPVTLGGNTTLTSTTSSVFLDIVNGGGHTLTVDTAANGSLVSAANLSAFTKTGAGILTLGAASTYTGTTTILDGTLKLGATASLPSGTHVAVKSSAAGSGATLDLNGRSQEIGSLLLGGNAGSSGSSVTLGAGGTLTLGGDVTFESTFNPLGASISGGTLELGGTRQFIVGDSTATTSGAADLFVSSVISGPGSGLVKKGAGLMGLGNANTYAGGTTISEGILYLTASGALPTGGNVTVNNTAGGTSFLTLNPGQTQTIGSLTLGGPGGTATSNNNVSIGAGSTLTLGGNLSYNASNHPLASTISGTGTLNLGGTTRVFSVGESNSTTSELTILAGITGTGTAGLVKSGLGRLVLAGAATYLGETFITGGRLQLSGANAFPTGGNLTINGLSGTTTFDLGAQAATVGMVTLGGANEVAGVSNNIDLAGGGTLTLGGQVSYVVGVDSSPGGSSIFGGSLSLGTATRTFAIANSSGAATELAISSAIGGTGGLTKTGDGVLALTGTSTYSGATTLNGGTLAISADANLGIAPASATPGHLALNGGKLQTTGTFTLDANRGVALAAGSVIDTGVGTVTYGGKISGSSGLIKAGTGTLLLSGTGSDYSGGTTLNGGGLKLGASGALPAGGDLVMRGSVLATEFDLAGFSQTIGALALGGPNIVFGAEHRVLLNGGTLTLGGNVTFDSTNNPAANSIVGPGTLALGGTRTFNIGNAIAFSDLSISANISGAGSGLIKTGAGTLQLSGTNTYSGGTTVAGGTLQLGASSAVPFNTAITVSAADPNAVATLEVGSRSLIPSSLTFAGQGTSRITMNTGDLTLEGPVNVVTTNAPRGASITGGSVALTGMRTFTIGDSVNADPELSIFSNIGATGGITLNGPGALLLAGSNSFGGGVLVQSGTLLVGQNNALGSGIVTINAAGTLAARETNGVSSFTLTNGTVRIDAGARLGLADHDGSLTFTGNVDVREFFDPSTTPVLSLRLEGESPTVFAGPIGTTRSNATLRFHGGGFAVLSGAVNNFTGVQADGAGVVFGSNAALTGSYAVSATETGYVGVIASTGSMPDPARLIAGTVTQQRLIADPAAFAGTFGFDTADSTNSAQVFRQSLDFSAFTHSSFRIGSATGAILAGPIKPSSANGYVFGNGGGILAIESALGGASGVSVNSREDQPLVVILRGSNTFAGDLSIANSAVILDSAHALPFTLGAENTLIFRDVNLSGSIAYFGSTEAFVQNAQYFADMFPTQIGPGVQGTGPGTVRILGLDSHAAVSSQLSGGSRLFGRNPGRAIGDGDDHLNLWALGSTGYLGTLTNIDVRDELEAPSGEPLRLVALEEGRLTVSSILYQEHVSSLIVGIPGMENRDGVVHLRALGTYTGGTTLHGGTLLVGHDAALGTGKLTIAGTSTFGRPTLASSTDTTVTLNNAVELSSVGLQLGQSAFEDKDDIAAASRHSLRLGGNIVGNGGLFVANGRTTLAGINNYTGGTTVGGGSLVFGSAQSVPATGLLRADEGGYIGAGFTTTDLGADFLSRFDQGGTTGTIGLDSVGEAGRYFGAVDLTGFNAAARLGSSTYAEVQGTITPQGGTYRFGGGGGLLQVSSALTGARGVAVSSPPGQSLTLLLTGANTYSGGTSIGQSAVIFTPASVPTGTSNITLNLGGYAGLQLPTSDANDATNIAAFLPHIFLGTTAGIVGLDENDSETRSVSTALTIGGAHALGTTSQVTVSGTLSFGGGGYRFAGYNGGSLGVLSALTGTGAVRIGDPNTPATAAAANGPRSTVTLAGSNDYTGGTDFYAGRLRVGSTLGAATSPLRVQLVNFGGDDVRLLEAHNGVSSLANPIMLNADLYVGGESSFSLAGLISGVGEIYKVGGNTLTLTQANTFSGGVYIAQGQVEFAAAGAAGTGPLRLGTASGASAYFSANATVNGIYASHQDDAIRIASGKTLTINQTFDSQFAGHLDDSGSILFQGPNVSAPTRLRLSGDSNGTYTGQTTINSGVAVIAAHAHAFGSGTVTLAGGGLAVEHGITFANPLVLQSGTLGGTGVLEPSAALQIGAGVVLAPGTGGTGTLHIAGGGTGASHVLQLNGGGAYQWQLTDATNPNGGWDGIYVFGGENGGFGNVQINATALNKFELKLGTVTADGGAGLAANFNPQMSYSWPLLTVTGMITVDGLTAANTAAISGLFSLNTSSFANSLVGFNGSNGLFGLSINQTGSLSHLALNFTPVPEPSTYALLAAGLLALGFRFRRQRRP